MASWGDAQALRPLMMTSQRQELTDLYAFSTAAPRQIAQNGLVQSEDKNGLVGSGHGYVARITLEIEIEPDAILMQNQPNEVLLLLLRSGGLSDLIAP